MNHYRTSQVAAIIGIHPNTVRLYEEWGLISKPRRLKNGYRLFTELHIRQFRLARTALQIELIQGGLRKKMISIIKPSAECDFKKAISFTHEYLKQLEQERRHGEEAIKLVRHLLSGAKEEPSLFMKRKEVSEYLEISMDTLRNWELNGLLTVRRMKNGYRIYTEQDIKRLKIIRALRYANYSLEAILRLLKQLSQNPDTDIEAALNTPRETDEIVSACDRLLVSLSAAEKNACEILNMLEEMQKMKL